MEKIVSRLRAVDKVFLLTVVIPVAIAILYFGVLSSSIYLSESRFVVRSPEKNNSSAGIGLLLKGAGFSNSNDEMNATKEYIESRDALSALNQNGMIARAYGNRDISFFDRFDAWGTNGAFEKLYRYFKKKITVEQDAASSTTTLTVRAYTPDDAYRINRELLEQAEALVNRLNLRGRSDIVDYASKELDEAKNRAQMAAVALAQFRNREGIVDPTQQATVQLQMVSKLQDELISTKTQLVQLRAFTPSNPQIPVLDSRVTGLSREIDQQLGKIAGGQRSLAASAVEFERLQLESEVADKQLASSIAALQDARNDARRKKAYVERIVQPNRPDYPLEPRRMRGILATLVVGLVAWGILTMLLAGIREHND